MAERHSKSSVVYSFNLLKKGHSTEYRKAVVYFTVLYLTIPSYNVVLKKKKPCTFISHSLGLRRNNTIIIILFGKFYFAVHVMDFNVVKATLLSMLHCGELKANSKQAIFE